MGRANAPEMEERANGTRMLRKNMLEVADVLQLTGQPDRYKSNPGL